MSKIGHWFKVRAMRKVTKNDVRYFPETGEIELARGWHNAKIRCDLFKNEGKDFLKFSGDSVIADEKVMVSLFKVLWNEDVLTEEQRSKMASLQEADKEENENQEIQKLTFADMSQCFITEPTEIFFRTGVHVRLD